jgi:TATA-binding protein-associated factor Taf7
MDLSNKELVKSLTSLIDDTLQEIEEIKKSKFAASEIKIEGPGDGLAGKPVNGDLHAKKKEEDEEEDEDEVEKAEEACKAEDDSDDEEEDEEEDEKDDKKKKKFDFKDLKKSMASSEELMKSYVDSKFSIFEERFEKMTAALESIANAPVARRGVPAGVQALAKSIDIEIQPLNKTDIANKLFELKKSGARVDSSDIFRVETTKDSNELKQIADKYGVK